MIPKTGNISLIQVRQDIDLPAAGGMTDVAEYFRLGPDTQKEFPSGPVSLRAFAGRAGGAQKTIGPRWTTVNKRDQIGQGWYSSSGGVDNAMCGVDWEWTENNPRPGADVSVVTRKNTNQYTGSVSTSAIFPLTCTTAGTSLRLRFYHNCTGYSEPGQFSHCDIWGWSSGYLSGSQTLLAQMRPITSSTARRSLNFTSVASRPYITVIFYMTQDDTIATQTTGTLQLSEVEIFEP